MMVLVFESTGQTILNKVVGFVKSQVSVSGAGKPTTLSIDFITTGNVSVDMWNTLSIVLVDEHDGVLIAGFQGVVIQSASTPCVRWGPFRRYDQSGLAGPITEPGVHLLHAADVSKKLQLVST